MRPWGLRHSLSQGGFDSLMEEMIEVGHTPVQTAMEVGLQRELISLRTKEALTAGRAAGKRLALHVSKASIAKITGVDRTTLYHFIRSRRLV